jgi:hypothetical protein
VPDHAFTRAKIVQALEALGDEQDPPTKMRFYLEELLGPQVARHGG